MIKLILDNLPDSEKRQLMYAFDHEFSQYVDLPNGRYIGVNVGHIKHLSPHEEAGVWSYGINKGAANGTNNLEQHRTL